MSAFAAKVRKSIPKRDPEKLAKMSLGSYGEGPVENGDGSVEYGEGSAPTNVPRGPKCCQKVLTITQKVSNIVKIVWKWMFHRHEPQELRL